MENNKFYSSIGVKSAKNQGVNNSSILDQSDFKIEDIIRIGQTQEEYLNYYCRLIDYSLQRSIVKDDDKFGYCELHHILPRCMGGEDSDYNYVLLSYREHVIAHILLYRIYPNEMNLVYSAMLMTCSRSKKNLEESIRSEFFSKLINTIEELRKKFKNSNEKSVVCHDESFNIIKIYQRMSDVEKDGFLTSKVSNVISGKRKSTGGYYWSLLSDFKNYHKDMILGYNNSDNEIKFIKPIDVTTKKIVCLDNNHNLIKIYNKVEDTKLDGFIPKNISAVLNKKQHSSGGYFCVYYKDYFKDNEKDIIISSDTSSPSPIEKEDTRVICYDENFNVLKIYTSFNNVKTDKFDNNSIRNIVNSETKFYGGYYWDTYTNFSINNIEKINEYQSNSIETCIVRKYWKYICLDIETKEIMKIYSSNSEIEKDGFSVPSVRNVILGKSKSAGGYYWMKYEDAMIERLGDVREYFKSLKHREIKAIDKRVVQLDLSFNVIKIYNSPFDIKNNSNFYWRSVSDKLNENVTPQYKGYYWMYYSNYEKLYPSKLQEFLKQ